ICALHIDLCIPRASVINLIIKAKTGVSVRRLYIVPYACVGLGGNFVGVVDGHITLGYEVYCATAALFSENKYNPLPIS
ncbi:P44 outer membrane protein, C-terminal fragment, partial [Anaplasma phagocytophilum str. HZ]